MTNFYLFSKEQFEVILTFGLCLIGWENGRRNLGLKGGIQVKLEGNYSLMLDRREKKGKRWSFCILIHKNKSFIK